MFKFLAWLHGLLFRLVLWACMLPLKALWATLLAIVALLGEETRRWVGLLVMGALIWLAGKGVLNFAPDEFKLPLVLTVLALVCIWAFAVLRAVKFTLGTNLRAVRQRMYFRELKGEVGKLGDRWDGAVDEMARRTQGSRAGRLFRTNRDADEAANERAEDERRAADADERRRDELADLEPSPY